MAILAFLWGVSPTASVDVQVEREVPLSAEDWVPFSGEGHSKLVQFLKGIRSRALLQEFAHFRKQFWWRHFWARGYLAVSSGNITDEMIQSYIDSQEGEPIHDDGRFQIDS